MVQLLSKRQRRAVEQAAELASVSEAEALRLNAERLAELSSWQRADRRRQALAPLSVERTEAQR